MAHKFKINKESLKREYAVYVVIARSDSDIKLYVGKTGDNREGCNPIISRCGNHFSYNDIHSQMKNKTENHESWEYTFIFEHFGKYDKEKIKAGVSLINEMERWLNVEIQELIENNKNCELKNIYRAAGYISRKERERRESFRTPEHKRKIQSIVKAVKSEIGG